MPKNCGRLPRVVTIQTNKMYVIFPTHVSTKEPIWFHAFVLSQKKCMTTSRFSILWHWNWNPGTVILFDKETTPWGLESWYLDTMEKWNPGTRESWNPGTLEPWNPGTLEPWNPGTLEPWNPGTLEPWNPRTLESGSPGTLEP